MNTAGEVKIKNIPGVTMSEAINHSVHLSM